MESIRENRPLMISLVGTYSFIVFLALGWSSDLCEQFGIIQFPEEVRLVIQSIIRIRAFYSSERQFNQYNFFLISVSLNTIASIDG